MRWVGSLWETFHRLPSFRTSGKLNSLSNSLYVSSLIPSLVPLVQMHGIRCVAELESASLHLTPSLTMWGRADVCSSHSGWHFIAPLAGCVVPPISVTCGAQCRSEGFFFVFGFPPASRPPRAGRQEGNPFDRTWSVRVALRSWFRNRPAIAETWQLLPLMGMHPPLAQSMQYWYSLNRHNHHHPLLHPSHTLFIFFFFFLSPPQADDDP